MAKILLVEDDTNLSEIYQARMEAEGYQVVSASDGESALAVAAQEKPDLIISDVMMPKISGFEMLDILRNTEGLKDTPVIMLTALGQADDKVRADSLGANRYLVKSQVTLEDIVNAAHALLEGDNSGTPPASAVSAPADSTNAADDTAATPSATSTPQDDATTQQAAPVVTEVPVVPVAVAPPAPTSQDPARATASFERRPVAPVRVDPVGPSPQRPTSTPAPVPAPAPPANVEPEPTPSPEPVPAPTAAAIDEQVVANAIDKIHGQVLPTVTPETAKTDDGRLAKKVISPISQPPTSTLEELLAREQSETLPASDGEKAQDQDPQESQERPQSPKPPFDPNSVSL